VLAREGVGRHGYDGGVLFSAFALADLRGRLVAVHLGHLHVHQDGVVVPEGGLLERLRAVFHHVDAVAEPFQHLERDHLVYGVVLGHEHAPPGLRPRLAQDVAGNELRVAPPVGGPVRVTADDRREGVAQLVLPRGLGEVRLDAHPPHPLGVVAALAHRGQEDQADVGDGPGYLPVEFVKDHVLAVPVSAVFALPPCEDRSTLIALDLEVHDVPLFGAHGAQPDRLALVIEDHGPVLGWMLLPRSVLRGGEEVAWGRFASRRGHPDRGRPQVRTRAVDPRRPRRRRRGHRPDGPVRPTAGQRQNREPRAAGRNLQKIPPRPPHAQPFATLPLATQTRRRPLPEAAILLRRPDQHTQTPVR